MSEKKKEAREALLGELESIKTLLSEAEWEHIPLLDDPVTGPVPIIDSSTAADIDTPATNADDPSLQINEELDFNEDDIPVLEVVFTPTDAQPPPQSLLQVDDPAHQLEAGGAPVAESSTDDALLTEAPTEDAQVIAASSLPPAEVTLADKPDWETAPEVSEPEPEPEPEPEIAAEDALRLSPRPFSPRPPELRTQDLRQQRPGTQRAAVERRGENPFLPQHIRERLHTHKTLVDIIKESPVAELKPTPPQDNHSETESLPKVLPQEKLNQLIDGLVAVYLPKIEAELRAKLRQAFQEDTTHED